MTTVSGQVARTLSNYVSDVFGLMGNGNAYFLDELLNTGVKYTGVRHEAGAVAAADAYARASGRIAAATVTYGAGFTNAITPLAEAVQARSPLVLVVGDAPTSGRRPWDVDQIAIAAAVGASTIVVDGNPAARTVEALQRAIDDRTAVVLAIPYDIAARPAPDEADVPTLRRPSPLEPDADLLAECAQILAAGQRPFLLAGRGAWLSGAGPALGRLAEALGAVTASTATGRGIFPDQRFDLGVTGGFGQEQAMALVHEADVALVVGARLNQFTMRFGELFGPSTRVIQIDLEEESTNPVVDRYLRGDAAATVAGLVEQVAAIGTPGSGWRDQLPGLSDGTYRVVSAGDGMCADARLDPRTVAARLGEILPADRRVVSDGGHFIGWANSHWAVRSPDRMILVGTNYQTIGLGIPSAIGAGAADPETTVVVTAGDGGSLMALSDLETVIRTVRRSVIVIWNDAAYGAEIHLYGVWGLAKEPMLIDEVDFAAVARGLGADGIVVRTPDDLDLLSEWLDTHESGSVLVDCRISQSVRAPYQEEILAVNTK